MNGRDTKLWPDGAPGAKGDQPNDKPTLTVCLPERAKATGTAVVVCPGGGYGGLAVGHEGKDIAAWFNMMGVAAFLIWNKGIGSRQVRIALGLFLAQLVLNGLWTPIFFGLHMMGLALAEIILLWMAILATIVSFWRISRTAAYLLIPYILWVSFAIALNGALWHLNR